MPLFHYILIAGVLSEVRDQHVGITYQRNEQVQQGAHRDDMDAIMEEEQDNDSDPQEVCHQPFEFSLKMMMYCINQASRYLYILPTLAYKHQLCSFKLLTGILH